jgi:hypothetical protein
MGVGKKILSGIIANHQINVEKHDSVDRETGREYFWYIGTFDGDKLDEKDARTLYKMYLDIKLSVERQNKQTLDPRLVKELPGSDILPSIRRLFSRR